jgi:hypothetical protein
MDVSLISAGPNDWEAWKKVMEAVTFVQNNDIGVGTTTDGDPYVTVHNRVADPRLRWRRGHQHAHQRVHPR